MKVRKIFLAMAVGVMFTACAGESKNEANEQETDVVEATETTVAPSVIKIGDNLAEVLTSAENVTYEYNADSGIWATIGNQAIIIDEEQLNDEGIAFIAAIPSDIAPDIDFKVEYLKPGAQVMAVETME